jgi:hypothetical protein
MFWNAVDMSHRCGIFVDVGVGLKVCRASIQLGILPAGLSGRLHGAPARGWRLGAGAEQASRHGVFIRRQAAQYGGLAVTPREPQGSALVAGRILDFWSSDWQALAERARLELFERLYLKLGEMLVQLPWVAGVQNNSTAAPDNLRRLGTGRGESRAETARIETELAAALVARGFEVVLNW